MWTASIVRSDISYRGDFVNPLFSLLGTGGQLFSALHNRLKRFDVRLSDFKIDQTSPSPVDLTVSCSLLSYNGSLRLRLDRCELDFFNAQQLTRDAVTNIFTEGLSGLVDAQPDVQFLQHTVNVGFHGRLHDVSPDHFLANYILSQKSNLGPYLGGGVVFYYGSNNKERIGSSIIVERSFLVEAGLYFRFSLVLNGSAVTIREIPSAFDSFFNTALSEIGVEIEGTSS